MSGWSQVVQFRLETTDTNGTPVDSITVGEEFLLKTYTQHVGGFESATNSGVFAGCLDISYDASLASVAGSSEDGPMYSNVRSGDLSVPGLMDNIGRVSSSGPDGYGLSPIGLDEQFVFSVPMLASCIEPGADILGSRSSSLDSAIARSNPAQICLASDSVVCRADRSHTSRGRRSPFP